MASRRRRRRSWRRGWTLLELLLVLAIIACVMSILLPLIGRIRHDARRVRCLAQLRDLGQALHTYAAENDGWMFPPARGTPVPPHERWPAVVFRMPASAAPLPYDPASYTIVPYDPEVFPPKPFTPPSLICPEDPDAFEAHSYLLNGFLAERGFRLGLRKDATRTIDQIVIAGEKKSRERDYYLNPTDYGRAIEPHRHGERRGSNYLFVDGHAETRPPMAWSQGVNPWDISPAH